MTTDHQESHTGTLKEPTQVIIRESMRKRRGQEVPAQEEVTDKVGETTVMINKVGETTVQIDKVEETTVQTMNMRKGEEEVEDITALKTETEMVGDTLATIDEGSAQGP